jgi:hypothetical protein
VCAEKSENNAGVVVYAAAPLAGNSAPAFRGRFILHGGYLVRFEI